MDLLDLEVSPIPTDAQDYFESVYYKHLRGSVWLKWFINRQLLWVNDLSDHEDSFESIHFIKSFAIDHQIPLVATNVDPTDSRTRAKYERYGFVQDELCRLCLKIEPPK